MSKSKQFFLWIFSILLISTPIVLYIYKFGFGLWNDHSKWAELGSYFGGILGPILSFVSILILWFSLKQSISGNQSQVDALEKQVKCIALTSFDSTFYAALKLIHEQANKEPSVKTTGFEATGEKLSQTLIGTNKNEPIKNSENLWRDATSYFETIFQVVELIERSEDLFKLGFRYKELFLSQLTETELFWANEIAIHCIDEPRKSTLNKWLQNGL